MAMTFDDMTRQYQAERRALRGLRASGVTIGG